MRIIETCPKCGHDLVDLVLTTYPPIPQKKCFSCGWEWTGEREEVVRVPFGGNTIDMTTINLCDYLNTTSTHILIDTEWIDGSSDIGYIGTITGNRFVVKFLDRRSHRKHIKYFAREDV